MEVYGKIWAGGTTEIGIEEPQAHTMVVLAHLGLISSLSQESVSVMLAIPRHRGTATEVVLFGI